MAGGSLLSHGPGLEGPLYLRLTAVVLGTLFLFAVLVLVIHLAAIGHATEPLRLESLRLMADATARDLVAGKQPSLPEPFAVGALDDSGRLLSGRVPLGGFRHGELQRPPGEGCADRGRPCWSIRSVDLEGTPARVVVYARLTNAPGLWSGVSLAFV